MECLICYQEDKDFVRTQCGHLIHDKCLKEILDSEIKKCPWCRRNYSYRDSVLIEKCLRCQKIVFECNCQFLETIIYLFAIFINIIFFIYFLKNFW